MQKLLYSALKRYSSEEPCPVQCSASEMQQGCQSHGVCTIEQNTTSKSQAAQCYAHGSRQCMLALADKNELMLQAWQPGQVACSHIEALQVALPQLQQLLGARLQHSQVGQQHCQQGLLRGLLCVTHQVHAERHHAGLYQLLGCVWVLAAAGSAVSILQYRMAKCMVL